MLAAALIVFREVLEAALVVTIVMAATRGLPRRGRWISLGILGGVVGASIVAALASLISSSFEGAGQEIVNAAILFLAVSLIGWHVVWMNSHGRRMAAEMRAVGHSVARGEKHMAVLAIVVGLAVMREGSEIVLMLQGLWASGSPMLMIGGGALGLAAGVLTGALMYAGFLALSVQRVFALTNFILVLIAAGMAARGANFLTQADLLPTLGSRLWDTSAILSDQSLMGQALGALIGYIARPNGIEVLFYAATVLIVCILMLTAGRQHAHGKHTVPAVALVLLGSGFLVFPKPALADEVISPYVEEHEWEIEQQGIATTHDNNPDNQSAKDLEVELGYSPTSWWRSELEGEFAREGGPDQESLHYDSFNWENTFQLAEPGEYWIDPGLFYEMDFGADNEPNNVIFGVVGAKKIGQVLTTVNLFGHKEYGPNAGPIVGFAYSDQTKYLWHPWLAPGFEIFGDTDGATRFADQQLAIGPGVFGRLYNDSGRELKYEVSYLFGATPASPTQAMRWKLEYEFFF